MLWCHALFMRINTRKWKCVSVWQFVLVPKNRNKRNECTKCRHTHIHTHFLTNIMLYIYPHLLLLLPPPTFPLSSLILFFFLSVLCGISPFSLFFSFFTFPLFISPALFPFPPNPSLPASCLFSFHLLSFLSLAHFLLLSLSPSVSLQTLVVNYPFC